VFHILLWILFLGSQCRCNSYINNLQISYIRNILTNPNTPLEIRKRTQEIIFTNYYPWLKKQVRIFKINNMNTLNFVMEMELHQYAVEGFLKAINNFDGNGSLVKYAEQCVKGRMYEGLEKMPPFQTINKNDRTMVVYNNNTIIKKDERIYLIKKIVLSMLPEEQKLFFSTYHFHTLVKIKSVYRICRMLQMSDNTYRKKMNVIKKYIRYRLRKMIF
jgi:hypothetical protein